MVFVLTLPLPSALRAGARQCLRSMRLGILLPTEGLQMTKNARRWGVLAVVGCTVLPLVLGQASGAQTPEPAPCSGEAQNSPRIPEVPVDLGTDIATDGRTRVTFTFTFAPGPSQRRIDHISISLPLPPRSISKARGWKHTIRTQTIQQKNWWHVEWVAARARHKLAPGSAIRLSLVLDRHLSGCSWTYGVGFDDKTGMVAGGNFSGIIHDDQ